MKLNYFLYSFLKYSSIIILFIILKFLNNLKDFRATFLKLSLYFNFFSNLIFILFDQMYLHNLYNIPIRIVNKKQFCTCVVFSNMF